MTKRRPQARPRTTTAKRARRIAPQRTKASVPRTLDARPDTLDFRDRMFEATLIEVPTELPLTQYLKAGVPILDQGQEGACTGFGLATVIHYLLRTRKVVPDRSDVSPWMLYEMARRYDEWPGERYEGSSARGAMKGWHKHGVCSMTHWPQGDRHPERYRTRFAEALQRPLGAYLRVNHKDVISMHSALSEVGVLYATATVHDGWNRVRNDGVIDYDPEKSTITGGHAFAIVAYDSNGFWIQNSWGSTWGRRGFAHLNYDDWLAHGSDVWVARLGAPIEFRSHRSVSRGVGVAAGGSRSYMFCDLRPHIVSLGNNGLLRTEGTYGTSADDVKEIFEHVAGQVDRRRHLVLYAHGGLVAEDSAIQKIADLRVPALEAGVFPISLIWHTDFWTTLRNILTEAVSRRRPEGFLDASKDFMLDRLDDALEPLARVIGGKSQWDEMKENAISASQPGGGLALVGDLLRDLTRRHRSLRIHLVGHSAGSILLGGLVERLANGGSNPLPIETCTLWAPACTMDVYRSQYLPSIRSGAIRKFTLFTLTDKAERDDTCANIYHKSLLYLVSNAFESTLPKAPFLRERDGEPLLGMAKFVSKLAASERNWDWVQAPNANPTSSLAASTAKAHGAFDDDTATLASTLGLIAGVAQVRYAGFAHHPSAAANRAVRAPLNAVT
jgi:alpha-beta hydrolase superfamily lysophospholipase